MLQIVWLQQSQEHTTKEKKKIYAVMNFVKKESVLLN